MRWWDIAPVVELERELFPDEPWSAEAFWAELAMGTNRCYLVAESDTGGLVGYAGLSCPPDARGADAEVMTVGVAAAAQGQRVGRTLVDALRAAAEERGAGRLLLEVRADNEVARKLYESIGFDQIAVRTGYYHRLAGEGAPSAVDALVLSLRLPARAPLPDSVSP
jgi:ribosomal-protein-alanine N-acetyltransferase